MVHRFEDVSKVDGAYLLVASWDYLRNQKKTFLNDKSVNLALGKFK